MFWKRLCCKSLLALSVLTTLPVAAWAGSIWLRAALEPVRRAESVGGTVCYRECGDRRSVSVEVHDIGGTDLVEVIAQKQSVGFIPLDETGAGSLYLDTNLGDEVPVLEEGETIVVRDGYEGFRILQGTLERVR